MPNRLSPSSKSSSAVEVCYEHNILLINITVLYTVKPCFDTGLYILEVQKSNLCASVMSLQLQVLRILLENKRAINTQGS